MIACPNCKEMINGNKETRNTSDGRVKRRRICPLCGYRFTTYEVYIEDMSKEELGYAFMPTHKRRKYLKNG